MKCQRCGADAPDTMKFCGQCGAALAAPAGGTVLAGRRFSDKAGQEASRRQVTVLFCDLVGSTALSERLDPEDLRYVLLEYQSWCNARIKQYDGFLAKYLGDGVLAFFGYPKAHEDSAARAVRAGLGIVDSVGALNVQLRKRVGVEIAVRIGIHTGLVVAGAVGSGDRTEPIDVIGRTPNIAARLEGEAEPNTVVISADTWRMVKTQFHCESVGARELKGINEKMEVYRVVEPLAGGSDYLAPTGGHAPAMVGRGAELDLLQGEWSRARLHQTRVALVSGAAGIGKSRFVQALIERLGTERARWLVAECSSYNQGSTLYPVIDLVNRTFGFTRNDDPVQKVVQIEQRLSDLGMSLQHTVPQLVSMLSLPLPGSYVPLNLPPAVAKQQLFEVLLEWIGLTATETPLLLVVEDLQWVDPTTREFIELLVQRAPAVPLMLVLVFRPEFEAPWSEGVLRIDLDRITDDDVGQLIDELAGGKALPEALRNEILEKTDGIPLFVQELTRMVLDSGVLKVEGDAYLVDGTLPAFEIPATLQDSLSERLDRLNGPKLVAQYAAVVGKQVDHAMLAAIVSLDEPALQDALQRLVEGEFLVASEGDNGLRYTFRHALIRDSAYSSMLKQSRARVHKQVVQVLQRDYPDIVEQQPEYIAYHCIHGGLHDLAIDYLQRAAERALARSGNVEALGHLDSAFEQLQQGGDGHASDRIEFGLRMARGKALTALRGHGAAQVEENYLRARDLARSLDNSEGLFQALSGLSRCYLTRADLNGATDLGQQLLDAANAVPDNPYLSVDAERALGCPLYALGRLTEARDHLQRGSDLAAGMAKVPAGHAFVTDLRLACPLWLVFPLWLLGDQDGALARSDQNISVARSLRHPFTLVHTLSFAAYLQVIHRDWQAALKAAALARRLARYHKFVVWETFTTVQHGCARVHLGDPVAGIAEMEQGIEKFRRTGAGVSVPHLLTLLAEARLLAGDLDDAAAGLKAAAELARESGEINWLAETLRLEGELALRNGADAAGHFTAAMEQANGQGALSLQLRVAMSQARHMQGQGRNDQAREQLGGVCAGFEEACRSPDIDQARALLAELV